MPEDLDRVTLKDLVSLLSVGQEGKRMERMREVAVFTALRAELLPLKALLSRSERVSREIPVYTGLLEGKRVILVKSGVGKERSLAAAKSVYSKYSPDGVLSTGFGGALVPELLSADAVLSSWVVSCTPESHETSNKLFLREQAMTLQTLLDGKGVRARVGGFACVPKPVVSPTEKRELARRTGAVIAEMETFHLGAFFLARKIPFMGMRTVFDSLEDRIPLLELAMEKLGGLGAFNRLWHLFSGRGDPSHLWRLYRNGRRTQIVLVRSVDAVVRVWPQEGGKGPLSFEK